MSCIALPMIGKTDWPPPDGEISIGDNKISNTCKRVRMSWTFALFFFSTFFDAILSGMPLDCLEKRRIFLPCCRGPPLLKSKRFLGFRKKRRFCPMRQFYIRVLRVYPSKATHQCSCQNRSGKKANGWFCTKRLNIFSVLLQCAEICPPAKKLFLIGSAASGLTVRLPNMDQMTGGGLK